MTAREEPTRVVLTVTVDGHVPHREAGRCSDLINLFAVMHLGQPLGDRADVDATTGNADAVAEQELDYGLQVDDRGAVGPRPAARAPVPQELRAGPRA